VKHHSRRIGVGPRITLCVTASLIAGLAYAPDARSESATIAEHCTKTAVSRALSSMGRDALVKLIAPSTSHSYPHPMFVDSVVGRFHDPECNEALAVWGVDEDMGLRSEFAVFLRLSGGRLVVRERVPFDGMGGFQECPRSFADVSDHDGDGRDELLVQENCIDTSDEDSGISVVDYSAFAIKGQTIEQIWGGGDTYNEHDTCRTVSRSKCSVADSSIAFRDLDGDGTGEILVEYRRAQFGRGGRRTGGKVTAKTYRHDGSRFVEWEPSERISGVKLSAYVMSQCPFANRLFPELAETARRLDTSLDLTVDYIGQVKGGGKLRAMHGDSEVMGNKVHVCVQENASREAWLDFLSCAPTIWRTVDENWGQCVRKAGIPHGAVRACVEGPEGTRLLTESYERSSAAKAHGSPTLSIAGSPFSSARTRTSLSQVACGFMKAPQNRYCANLPTTPTSIVFDPRCSDADCPLDELERELRLLVPGAKVARLGVATKQGRALHEASGLPFLTLLAAPAHYQAERANILKGFTKAAGHLFKSVGRFDPVKGQYLNLPEVTVTILTDRRCKSRACTSVSKLQDLLARKIENMDFNVLDYSTAAGKALWKRVSPVLARKAGSAAPGLPLAVFDEDVTEHEQAMNMLRRRMVECDSDFVWKIGDWDPTKQ